MGRSSLSPVTDDSAKKQPALSIVNLSKFTPFSITEKDLGSIKIIEPPSLPHDLESIEQEILRQLHDLVGNVQMSEADLHFLPCWIIDKAIAKEMENYKDAFREVEWMHLPKCSNVISSHHFFDVKLDGRERKYKLRCRLVPHGNRDRYKNELRTDSSTAQFPAIRLVFSLAALHGFALATLDIKGAYLQSGPLCRDIYMRPPASFCKSKSILWKLLKATYGLVEAGRLWKLAIEEWMSEQGFEIVPGMPQVFVLRNENK